MPKTVVKIEPEDWTWGAEHELADWDVRGYDETGVFRDDETEIVNTNGIAADPKLVTYPYGGEFNTPATDTIDEQLACLEKFLADYPEAAVSYRSTLHIHIRVPGLASSLKYLKKVQSHIVEYRDVFPLVHHPFEPEERDYLTEECWRLAKVRRREINQADLTIPNRLEEQLETATVADFYVAGVPKRKTDGKPQWHLQTRPAVNIMRLRTPETETIEFRCFSGSIDLDVVKRCFDWARDFIYNALHDVDEMVHYEEHYAGKKFPQYEDIGWCPWHDRRYWATITKKHKRPDIIKTIDKILNHGYLAIPEED